MNLASDDPAAGAKNFERFFVMVVAESELFDALRAALDGEALAQRAVELGRARGCEFGRGDVQAALTSARRSWSERRSL